MTFIEENKSIQLYQLNCPVIELLPPFESLPVKNGVVCSILINSVAAIHESIVILHNYRFLCQTLPAGLFFCHVCCWVGGYDDNRLLCLLILPGSAHDVALSVEVPLPLLMVKSQSFQNTRKSLSVDVQCPSKIMSILRQVLNQSLWGVIPISKYVVAFGREGTKQVFKYFDRLRVAVVEVSWVTCLFTEVNNFKQVDRVTGGAVYKSKHFDMVSLWLWSIVHFIFPPACPANDHFIQRKVLSRVICLVEFCDDYSRRVRSFLFPLRLDCLSSEALGDTDMLTVQKK